MKNKNKYIEKKQKQFFAAPFNNMWALKLKN